MEQVGNGKEYLKFTLRATRNRWAKAGGEHGNAVPAELKAAND